MPQVYLFFNRPCNFFPPNHQYLKGLSKEAHGLGVVQLSGKDYQTDKMALQCIKCPAVANKQGEIGFLPINLPTQPIKLIENFDFAIAG